MLNLATPTGYTILIVDDHMSFRRVAAALLEAEGVHVVGEAADGREALLAAAALGPDVVLLDIQLPDTDGFAVAGRLAAADPAPIVVLTSARDQTHFGDLIGRSGARGFISKSDLSGPALAALIESSAA